MTAYDPPRDADASHGVGSNGGRTGDELADHGGVRRGKNARGRGKDNEIDIFLRRRRGRWAGRQEGGAKAQGGHSGQLQY